MKLNQLKLKDLEKLAEEVLGVMARRYAGGKPADGCTTVTLSWEFIVTDTVVTKQANSYSTIPWGR